MEFRLVILLVTCFACLIPEAHSINLLAAKAVAGQAKNDIASIGINTLAAKKAAVAQAASDIASIAASGVVRKGKVLKTAAISIAGAMLNGALSVGKTLKRAGFDLVAASLASHSNYVGAPVVIKPTVLKPVQEIIEYKPEIEVPILNRPIFEVAGTAYRPFTYEIIETPRLINGPRLFKTFQFRKK